MADVAFTCPQCGHQYQFAAELAGKRGRCKACRAVFRIAEPSAASTVLTAPEMRPKPAPPPDDDGRVALNCPSCGRPCRLDVGLASKQGRCTSCRGIFTIPAKSGPSSPRRGPEAHRTARPPTHPGGGTISPPAMSPAAGDSGWWELDSSESIPARTAGPVAGRPRASADVPTRPVLSPGEWTPVDDDDDGPIITARPVRPKWVLYAAIAAGVLVGAVASAITYSLVSNASGTTPPPVAKQPKAQPPQTAIAEADEDADETVGDENPPEPQLAGTVGQHREAVDALTRAYQKIADGYARIRDAGSIAEGRGPVAQAVAELRAASQRGKALPPLSPPDRRALIQQAGPALLQAVDRVLDELRRLRKTPGLRADFDGLIASYSRTREEIRREVDQP